MGLQNIMPDETDKQVKICDKQNQRHLNNGQLPVIKSTIPAFIEQDPLVPDGVELEEDSQLVCPKKPSLRPKDIKRLKGFRNEIML